MQLHGLAPAVPLPLPLPLPLPDPFRDGADGPDRPVPVVDPEVPGDDPPSEAPTETVPPGPSLPDTETMAAAGPAATNPASTRSAPNDAVRLTDALRRRSLCPIRPAPYGAARPPAMKVAHGVQQLRLRSAGPGRRAAGRFGAAVLRSPTGPR